MQKITINRLPQGEILPLRRLKPGFILSLIISTRMTKMQRPILQLKSMYLTRHIAMAINTSLIHPMR